MKKVKCPYCGHKNSPAAHVCEECGSRLTPAAEWREPSAEHAPVMLSEEEPAFEKPAQKAVRIAEGLYTIIFLLFWFGFLIVFEWIAIKDWANSGKLMALFSIPFWIAGVAMLIGKLKGRR